MGNGRNDMEKEQSALFATAVSLGAALLGGGAKLALDNMKATSVAPVSYTHLTLPTICSV